MQELKVNSSAQLSLFDQERNYIPSSPIGILVVDKKPQLPLSAQTKGDELLVNYPCGECKFKIEKKKGYHKITITSVPDVAEAFSFGPYYTKASSYGEILGAAWFDDSRVVCIQSLLPKVVGGFSPKLCCDTTELSLLERNKAACSANGKISLQCSVLDLSKEEIIDSENTIRNAVPGEDGKIQNASIALIASQNGDALLEVISDMELAEGLPHPTYRGKYAKTDKRVSSLYLIIKNNDFSNKQLIDMADRAGSNCVYFSDIFSSWGHFNISKYYPEGTSQVRELSDYAWEHDGIVVGAHALSNFIHRHDEFVTPIPNKKLLIVNRTTLSKNISSQDTEIFINDTNNYHKNSNLNLVRIGDEIIKFTSFDPERKCLCGCLRGECNTNVTPHSKNDPLLRLADHPYLTLFPDIELQDEMAEFLGNTIVACGMRRLSFDGLEGCYATHTGEYALSKFVKKVFDITGNDFTCDASTFTHYLWHALCYANWGEPWLDSERRGGMPMHRANHIPFFKRNLIPLMMGWYAVYSAKGRFEATPPENMEFILSRSAAFDAGLAINFTAGAAHEHGLFGEYLDLAKLWGDFRHKADIPEDVLLEMQRENSNWHLEKTKNGWKLTSLFVHSEDLEYTERFVETETGFVATGDQGKEEEKSLRKHSCELSIDAPAGEDSTEVYHFRLRVGEPGHGLLIDPEFVYFGLKFKLTAIGGDYLVYKGGTKIYHYDKNFNLKAVVESEPGGREMLIPLLHYITVRFTTDTDEVARYVLTDFRRRREIEIGYKKDLC